jgi:putative ABC transport system ATP-binding protein
MVKDRGPVKVVAFSRVMLYEGCPMPSSIITLTQLGKTYSRGHATVAALRDVNLDIWPGDFCAFVGPSGCGKSTLLHLIAGLDTPTSGDLLLNGRSTMNLTSSEWTTIRRNTIGIIFQGFHLVPALTAEENIALPLMLRGDAGRAVAARVEEVLDLVGMRARRRHRPGELSGGEQQRVAIARAVAHRPSLLLADEPTGNLDSSQGGDIMTLIRTLAKASGQTVLLVTHSHDAALNADYIWAMQDGRLQTRTEASSLVTL